MTEQNKIEDLLRETEARLKALEIENFHLKEDHRRKYDFLNKMSHELCSPLNSIIGFSSILHGEKAGPLSAQQKEFLTDIRTSSAQLLQLINDIVELARSESNQTACNPELVDIAKLISEVQGMVSAIASEKRLKIQTKIDPLLITISLDRAKLKKILYHYLLNAVKFSFEEGLVVISVSPEQKDRVRIDVEDSGSGIDQKDFDKLFVAFRKLKSGSENRYPGSGLGLALTKQLVEAQGGAVEVKSMLGKGSTFSAILPRDMTVNKTKTKESLEFIKGAPTVLVIEDNPKDRDWISTKLHNAGYSVMNAETGADAIALCNQRSFEAITLDLLLPDGSGWEILQKIRSIKLNCEVPTIVITHSAKNSLANAFTVQDFLVKPISEETLLAALKRIQIPPQAPVLVVDDDPSSLKLIAAILKNLGFRAICNTTCEEALQTVKNELPSLIVLDLLMPKISGFEFIDRLKQIESGSEIPVIVWTSKDLTKQERLKLEESVQAIVLKGKEGQDIIEVLGPILSRENKKNPLKESAEKGCDNGR